MVQYALDYSFSNSFDNVAKRYASIKPVVSKYHARGDDIRPFGNRRNKFERIEKVSGNKYAIHDGAWVNNAPMVWERTKRGDVLTIHTGSAGDNTRIAFLNYALPPALELRHALGGHIIQIFAGWRNRLRPGHTLVSPESPVSTHYLPNSSRYKYQSGITKTLTRHILEDEARQAYLDLGVTNPTQADIDRSVGLGKEIQLPVGQLQRPLDDEEYKLQFLHLRYGGNTFKCISGGYPVPRKRVNKAKKAALKVPLAEFYAWVCDIGKLLPYNDLDYRQQNSKEVYKYKRGVLTRTTPSNISVGITYRACGGLTIPLALEIIEDYNHPLRTHLACHFLQRTNSVTIHDIDNKDDASRFRLCFNRWVNQTLGLIEVVTTS